MTSILQPTPTLDDLRQLRDEILQIAERYGASNVRVFGSVARGDARPDSDVDLLVDFAPTTSLYEMVGLWLDLKELLGREVDVADSASPKKEFIERISDEAVLLAEI